MKTFTAKLFLMSSISLGITSNLAAQSIDATNQHIESCYQQTTTSQKPAQSASIASCQAVLESPYLDKTLTAITQHNIGVILQNQGKLDKALQHYQKALSHNNLYMSNVAIGQILHQQGEFEQAISFYQQALSIDSSDALLAKKIQLAKQRISDSQLIVQRTR